MEAHFLWFKGPGLVVIEQCTIGRVLYERPEDYVYDHVVINFLTKHVYMYPTRTERLVFSASTYLPVPDLIVREFIELKLGERSSSDIYEILEHMDKFFGHCTAGMCDIGIHEIEEHRRRILDPLVNYLPAAIIQRAWRRCITNPAYKVCRDRLWREASEIGEVVCSAAEE